MVVAEACDSVARLARPITVMRRVLSATLTRLRDAVENDQPPGVAKRSSPRTTTQHAPVDHVRVASSPAYARSSMIARISTSASSEILMAGERDKKGARRGEKVAEAWRWRIGGGFSGFGTATHKPPAACRHHESTASPSGLPHRKN